MRDTMAAEGKIGPEDLQLFCLTDDVDEAVRYIVDSDTALAAEQDATEEAATERAAADVAEAAEAAEAADRRT
jgi:hypothetical protein